jgi:glutamine synthetase
MTFVKAIKDNAQLIRASVASAGNDLRLGANEAPPAIMSVFLGTGITDIIDKICSGDKTDNLNLGKLDLGIAHLPNILKDNTDRNRTAPIAFTGNKMEFRAPGSSESIGLPVTFINAAMTDAIESVCRLFERLSIDNVQRDCLIKTIKMLALETADIRFDGNCYDKAWQTLAEQRGLPVLKNTPQSVNAFFDEKLTEFLVSNNVFSKTEIKFRGQAALERYSKTIDMEAHVLLDMVISEILPALDKSLTQAGNAIGSINSCAAKDFEPAGNGKISVFQKRFENIFSLGTLISQKADQLSLVKDQAKAAADNLEKAFIYADNVIPLMDEIRLLCSNLEKFVSSENWPYPKYWEILF